MRLLAIDQGTTSSRAILYDGAGSALAESRRELLQSFPRSGWVEHDPERIWEDTLQCCREALERGGAEPSQVSAIGITNQRETTLVWERASGRPIHPAIVWQDRRTADRCRELREGGHEERVTERTGLLLDPYFSATKIRWILDHVGGARTAAERGELAAGTVDTWLIWKLTGGRRHVTDASNAARTSLFDIHVQAWDAELLDLFGVPRQLLPEVVDSAGSVGETESALLGGPIAITGIAGDQQAAMFGQAAFEPGMMKSTYGTGCFVLLNTGSEPVTSRNRLLTTIAWRLNGVPTYALEGSIFVAGAAIQWLRDGLGILDSAAESQRLAESVEGAGGVYMVPAFVGLGAPYWDPDARGALLGLTRDTGRAHIVRAALEAVAFQTRDLLEAMSADGAATPAAVRVDGGLAANDWAMQKLADTLDIPIERPLVTETTALGAAYLAGLGAGVYSSLSEVAANWRQDHRWEPGADPGERARAYAGWRAAVDRVLTT